MRPWAGSRRDGAPLDTASLPQEATDRAALDPRTLLVAIGAHRERALDARALHAIRYAPLIPARERHAVHVATDAAAAECLAVEWMERELGAELRLSIVDPVGTVADTLAVAAADRLNAGVPEVVVLTPRRAPRGIGARVGVGTDGTATRIARELGRVHGARAVLLDVPA